MTKNELIDKINRELKISFTDSYESYQKEINNIIEKAKKYFYENHSDAVEIQYFIAKNTEFKKQEFKKDGIILLPDDVLSVYDVKEIKGDHLSDTSNKDLFDDEKLYTEFYSSMHNKDTFIFRISKFQYFDLLQSFFTEWIEYSYDRDTHSLKFLGKHHNNDVLIMTYIKIPEENIYENCYFLKHVINQCKNLLKIK
ncbi:MAG TPA: hypothetical protein PKY44_06175 [Bacteroidales bacterium]|nr:hypothetical protein [Bacteroidales bacterium]